MKKNTKILAIAMALILILTGTAYATNQSQSTTEQNIPSRQEILSILLNAQQEGSHFIIPTLEEMAEIQKWLRATTPDEESKESAMLAYHLDSYYLGEGYTLSLSAKRTLILSNKDGWTLETYNVDYESMEIDTDFVVGKSGTYVTQDGKMFRYIFGEKTEVGKVSITSTTYVWSSIDYQMIYIQDGSDLGIVLSDGTFLKIASNYGYGIKMISCDDSTVIFQYISSEKKQEAIVVFEKDKEDNSILKTMKEYGVAIEVETL